MASESSDQELDASSDVLTDEDGLPEKLLVSWKQLIPDGSGRLPKRHGQSCILHDGKIMCFGGSAHGWAYHDLFSYDLATNTWAHLKHSGSSEERVVSDHAGFYYDNRMWIFGGRGHADSRDGVKSGIPQRQNNDLWTYDFSSDLWTLERPVGALPCPRKAPGWIVSGSRLFISGGWNGRDCFDDTWFLDLDEKPLHWVQVQTTGKYDGRHSCQLAYVESENVLLSFGGCSGYSRNHALVYHRSIRQLDLNTGVWSRRPTFGRQPRRSEGHSACLVGPYWYIFGGHNLQRYFNRLYRFNLETNLWERYSFGSCPGFFLMDPPLASVVVPAVI